MRARPGGLFCGGGGGRGNEKGKLYYGYDEHPLFAKTREEQKQNY